MGRFEPIARGRLVEQARDLPSQPATGGQQELDHPALREIRRPAKWQNAFKGA
jgi:hypothetical protein